MSSGYWNLNTLTSSVRYTCGFCGSIVASNRGLQTQLYEGGEYIQGDRFIVICPHCDCPTYFEEPDHQTPGVPFGSPVTAIPDRAVSELYDEARRAIAAGCNTAAVLCCRKLLMHVGVDKGAEQDLRFVAYVEFLLGSGYLPPDARSWLDHIRSKGNEANHEITIMPAKDAQDLVTCAELLLKVIYEFPNRVSQGPDQADGGRGTS